ncbi:hypothetical protein D0812_14800 [Vibrio owensii]|uniref:Uncharacterized protein n=1 Tax=Vibrio owensii TaxID=696485 RepID=A0ABN5Q3V8_9VIBR|nr:hypothetical protein D0812_14800 [Vibrio owensii]
MEPFFVLGKREARSEKREARSEKREARSEKREARSEKREARSEKREARSEKREARSEKREARSEKREASLFCLSRDKSRQHLSEPNGFHALFYIHLSTPRAKRSHFLITQ